MASHVQNPAKKKKKWKKPIPELTPQSKKKETNSTPATSFAPRGINVAEFAESRALEIHNMVEAMVDADKSSRKRLFQQLPRHMRRRAMSYNVKRLPVRLREEAEAEMDKIPKQKEGKKKSRRYRREPKNLLAEYTRRQRQHVWLETHIWHAKRMKMVDRWGYRLAECPCDKGFRAAHRAVTNSCTIQDISYYGCIEVCGKQTKIIEAIGYITNQDAGPTIKSSQFLAGHRQGQLVLYQTGRYPNGAVGPVNFVWRQNQNIDNHSEPEEVSPPCAKKQKLECEDCRQLWIWSHPSSFNEVFDVIVEACKMVSVTSVKKDDLPEPSNVVGEQNHQDVSEKRGKSVGHKISLNNFGYTSCGTVGSACSNAEYSKGMLSVTSLKHNLLRFRLTGPQSHALLQSTLVLHSSNEQSVLASIKGMDGNVRSFNNGKSLLTKHQRDKKWWNVYSSDLMEKQKELWKNLQQVSSPGLLPSHCVVSLIVMDPRLNMPHKKTSVNLATEDAQTSEYGDISISDDLSSPTKYLVQWPKDLAASPIWESHIREIVKDTKMSEHELNRRRSEQLVPGTDPHLADEASWIPILLFQHPPSSGTNRSPNSCQGYGGGWDIVLPSGWGMPFWMALIYRGARAVGLKEARACALEKGELCFPRDFPDTASGRAHNDSLRVEGEQQYVKYPPAKRPNYHMLGFHSPFSFPLDHLVQEWKRKYCIVSEEKVDQDKVLCNCDNGVKEATRQTYYVLRSKSLLGQLREVFNTFNSRRGRKDHREKSSPRKSLPDFSEHYCSLVCVSLRMLGRGSPSPCAAIAIPTLDDLRTLNKEKSFSGPVEPLHKGSREQVSSNLIGCCTREIIGYVTAGDYSLARGAGAGLGFCILQGLLKVLELTKESNEFIVLVRNTTTQQYRFAYLTVI